VPDRATIGNMSPEYGATIGYFPVDQESVNYLRATGRSDEQCAAFENYFRAQKMFGLPRKGEIDYSVDLELDLADVQPGVAGPKRPQDRINLPALGETFRSLLQKPISDGGYGKKEVDLSAKHLVQLNGTAPGDGEMASTDKKDQGIQPGDERNKIEMVDNRPTPDTARELEDATADPFHHGQSRIGHGSVLIAAITSCTNTSNPSVMLAAGLLAKKAVERSGADHSGRATIHLATATAAHPFARSSSSATTPGSFPKERATFVAPTLRLPCWRMSAPATSFTTRKLNGIEPRRYATTTRAAGSMRRAF
jgi:aconitate hydratase